jgi:tetratricopeptide (TPR) repeat protein
MPRKQKILPQPPIGLDLLQSTFIVNNTTKVFHTLAVDKIMDEAMPLLRAGKGAQAEVLFRKALTLEPLKPDLLNNLAQALELQGFVDEGLCISKTILILFPDYLFARAALAAAAMREDDYEDAIELLTPLFARREFHISEYNVLCSVLIEYCLLTGNYPAARLWFDAWSGPDPKNPKLDVLRELLKKINA